MKRKRVVIIDGGYPSYRQEIEILNKAGYQVDIFEGERHAREEKIKFCSDAVGIFVRWTMVDEKFLRELPNLKAILRYGVGYDNIDISAASARGVKVSNVQGYANHAVSEHALALMFACARGFPRAKQAFQTNFTNPPREDIFEFHNKTLGIIGLGRIGGALAKKSECLFEEIIACDPYIDDSRFAAFKARKVSLNELLEQSHIISLHCNLTEETRNLIDRPAIEKMKQKPILVNTARGPVADEMAVLDALNNGKIHSAGLDVFWDEPPRPDRQALIEHPHVFTTGHYAWYSKPAFAELRRRAATNMLMLLQGKIPEDCLNP